MLLNLEGHPVCPQCLDSEGINDLTLEAWTMEDAAASLPESFEDSCCYCGGSSLLAETEAVAS